VGRSVHGQRQGADRRGFNHWSRLFGHHRRFDRCFNDWRWSRCSGFNHWRGSLGFFNHRGFNDWRWRFSDGRLGNPVERGLFFANFTHGFGHGFSDGFSNRLCGHDWRFNHRSRFGSDVSLRLSFANRATSTSGAAITSTGVASTTGASTGAVSNSGGGAFGLLVSLCFGRSADHAAGNSGGHGQAGSQFGSAWSSGVFAGLGFFRTFDHVAVGIALTLATVAATTLATGATAWTIAFGVVLTVFRQLLFVGVHFFFSDGSSGLLGARLTLFTRRTRCAFFAWLTGRTLFCDHGGSGSRYGCSRSGVQRLAQFTHALHARHVACGLRVEHVAHVLHAERAVHVLRERLALGTGFTARGLHGLHA
jgi:hypothetical protein